MANAIPVHHDKLDPKKPADAPELEGPVQPKPAEDPRGVEQTMGNYPYFRKDW